MEMKGRETEMQEWRDERREKEDRRDKLLMLGSLNWHVQVASLFFFFPFCLSGVIKGVNLVRRSRPREEDEGGKRTRR